MEGPVKERLTGALILVAAGVIIVPEMLSGPGPQVATPAVTPQPADAGAPLRTYSVLLNDSAGPGAPRQAMPVVQPVAEPAVEAVANSAPAAVTATTADANPKVTTVEPAIAAADLLPVAPGNAKPDVPTPTPTPTPASAGRWWAQLGSFSAQENADRLTKQLRAAGYAVDMSKVSAAGKELYRVRAGPVGSRMEAQALQSRLAVAGHKSSIVAP